MGVFVKCKMKLKRIKMKWIEIYRNKRNKIE